MPMSEILTAIPLNIDWQQILLHLLNFLILAVVLTLLIYRPVKRFLEKRKKHYEDRENDIEEKRQNAEEMQSEYEHRLSGVEDEITYRREAARREAEEAARRTTEAADDQAAEILSRAQSGAEAQKRKLIEEAGSDITNMVVSATEKLLAASQSEKTDAALYERFISGESATAAGDLGTEAERNARLTAQRADMEAERIIRAAREDAGREADMLLETAKSGIADVVAAATEKLLTDLGSVNDADIYDKFLAEAERSEQK